MRKFKTVLAGVAVATMMASSSAHALVWTSQLEYKDGVAGPISPSFGTVTIKDGADGPAANTVEVTVTLASPDSRFINTGGPHNPFVFNTVSDDVVTIVSNGVGGQAGASFYDGGHGAFYESGFGQPSVPFTDEIGLHVLVPDVPAVPCVPKSDHNPDCKPGTGTPDIPAHFEEAATGGGTDHGRGSSLVFDVYNASGITFAGVGAGIDPITGKFTGVYGSGEHFESTSQGWWFVADIYDAGTGLTYNVAAKDAITTPGGGVPEPAAWALMILGFGGAGAMLRRRRAALA